MKQLILHIGRHKSGTTAIQRFLRQNSELLDKAGFCYPNTGIRGYAHHLISEPLQIQAVRKSGLKSPQDLPLLNTLHEEIEANPAQRAIVSSEAFQNCDPAMVREAFSAYDTRVVVYIRDQLEYLTSAYAQRVHGTNYAGSLEDYFREIFAVDYFDFLNRWEKQFPEALLVRKFSRSSLNHGDVVTDFMTEALGLTPEHLQEANVEGETNPSLNARIVLLKVYLNKEGYYHDDSRKYLYRLLPKLNKDFPGSSLRVPKKMARKLIAQCQKSDRATANKYFGDPELFDYSGYQTAEHSPLQSQELAAMLLAVDQQLQPQGKKLADFKLA